MEIEKVALDAATSLINSENLQKSTNKIMGMLFPYVGLERKALDVYISDIENSNLPAQSKVYAILNAKKTIKEIKNQKEIADKAISYAKEGTDFSADSGVNPEWLERFMDSSKFVSDDEIQAMWAKILCNEFEAPGSTPSNMIRILSEISPRLAKAFQIICSMNRLLICVDDDGIAKDTREETVVPYHLNLEEMHTIGITYNVLAELETLGLIKLDATNGFIELNLPDLHIVTYTDGITKEIKRHRENTLPIGNVILTDSGKCLKKITQSIPISDYEKMEKKYMIRQGIEYEESTRYRVFKNGAFYCIQRNENS